MTTEARLHLIRQFISYAMLEEHHGVQVESKKQNEADDEDRDIRDGTTEEEYELSEILNSTRPERISLQVWMNCLSSYPFVFRISEDGEEHYYSVDVRECPKHVADMVVSQPVSMEQGEI